MLNVELFGDFRATIDGTPVSISSRKSRVFLGALAARCGRPVTIESLIDSIWDSEPPATAHQQVRKVAADLRRRIAGGPRYLLTDGPAYLLDASTSRRDFTTFTGNINRAQALFNTEPDEALTLMREAVELWAPLFEGGPGQPFEHLTRTTHSQYLTVAERLYEYRLRTEPPQPLVAPLEALALAEPYAESLQALYLSALHGAGRTAEALKRYDQVRSTLSDELGIDPGSRLQDVFAQLLSGEPVLQRGETHTMQDVPADPPHARVPEPVAALAPSTIPPVMGKLHGREPEVKALVDTLADAPGHGVMCVVSGLTGSGKTTLVLHAVHSARHLFPDGQLYVDLVHHRSGSKDPAFGALAQLLEAFGVSSHNVPSTREARIDTWRSLTARRSVMLVIDGVESADDVTPLLTASSSSATVVVSRNRLTDLQHCDVRLVIEGIDSSSAVALLNSVLGARRAEEEPAQIAELAELCSGFPLALTAVGSVLSRRPGMPISEFLDMAEVHRDASTPEHLSGIMSALSTSFEQLPQRLRAVARKIAPLASISAFSRHAAAAWLDLPLSRVMGALDDLCEVNYLTHVRRDEYTMPTLVSSMLASTSAGGDEDQPVDHLVNFLHHGSDAAHQAMNPLRTELKALPVPVKTLQPKLTNSVEACSWFNNNHHLVAATLQSDSITLDPPVAYAIIRGYLTYLQYQNKHHEAMPFAEMAVEAVSHPPHPELLPPALLNRSLFVSDQGRIDRALEDVKWAEEVVDGQRFPNILCTVLLRLGALYSGLGQFDDADALTERARNMGDALSTRQVMLIHATSSFTAHRRGHFQDAIEHCETIMKLDPRPYTLGFGYLVIGSCHLSQRAWEPAVDMLLRSMTEYLSIAGSERQAQVSSRLSWAYAELGDRRSSREHYNYGIANLADAPLSIQAEICYFLGRTQLALGDDHGASWLERAADIGRSSQNVPFLADAEYALGTYYQGKPDAQQAAADHLRRAEAMFDDMATGQVWPKPTPHLHHADAPRMTS